MSGVIPELRADLVERSRLLALLSAWRRYGVIKVQAPAGFGKTTLASMWLRRLQESGPGPRPKIAWVPLDEQHTTADDFLNRLHHGLAPSHSSLQLPHMLLQAGQIPAASYLDAVVRACDADDAPTIVIVDDAHFLHDRAALNVLQMLIDRSTAHLHTLLLCRTAPDIDLVRHTLAGRVLTIQTADLSFDEVEFDALTAMSRLSEIDAARRRRIAEHSRGWIAGLQMMIHSLPPSGPLTESVVLTAQSRDDAADYLERELLNRLPERMLDLLTRTSFLPFLHADLCAAVTGRSSAECARILSDSVTATGFVDRYLHPEPGPEVVFRIHVLLRDHLLRLLRASHSERELRTLRESATRWFSSHDQIDAALGLLLLPSNASDASRQPHEEDFALAADILEAACMSALRRADVGFVVQWLDRLPESVVAARPRLALDAAWADFHTLRPRLHSRITLAQQAIAHAGRRSLPTTALTAELAVLQALCAAFEGDIDETERALHIADAVHDDQLPIPAGYLHLLRAYHFGTHRLGAAARQHEVKLAIQAFRDGHFLRGQVEAFTLSGVIETYGLDGSHVLDRYRTGLDFIRMVDWELSPYGINTHLYIGDALYVRNRITEARTHFERVLELAAHAGAEAATGYFARLCLQLCDDAEHLPMRGISDHQEDVRAWREIRRYAAPRLWHSMAYMRMIRDLHLERTDQCISDLADMHLLPDQIDETAVPMSVLTSVAGAFFSSSHVAAAAQLLDRFCARMEAIDYATMLLRARILQVLHLRIIGNDDDALEMLQKLLPAVEQSEMHRALIDITPLRPLLRRCNSAIARTLIALDVGRTPQHAARPFNLSTQEIAVLRKLTAIENTHAIAADMSISYSTVRTHLRNCFRKMNVHSRLAAIEAARAAGLLE
jgi:LuxR family maltose regulon positive regulatory protein